MASLSPCPIRPTRTSSDVSWLARRLRLAATAAIASLYCMADPVSLRTLFACRPGVLVNKGAFRDDCAERKNGFVAGANCFGRARGKKQLAGMDRSVRPNAAGTGGFFEISAN